MAAAARLRDAGYVPMLVRPDADSVLAAGLVGVGLHRAGVPWQARCVERLDAAALRTAANVAPGGVVVLAGWGALEQDALREAGFEAVVLDARHPGPEGAPDAPCASALAWDLARALDPRAPALPALAGLAAAGPAPGSEALRAELTALAVQQGARPGWLPATRSGPAGDALAEGVLPYLPGIGQNNRAARGFLERIGVPESVPVGGLPAADAERLASGLVLHLLAHGAAPAAAHLLLAADPAAPVPGGGARGLARLCQAACHAGQPGLALGLALGDGREEARAQQLAEGREQRLLQALRKLDVGGPGAPPSLPRGPLDAEPDIAADLALAAALSLGGGAAVAVRGGSAGLHIAAPGVPPAALGAAARAAAREVAGDEARGWALGPRAVVEVPEARAADAWARMRRLLEAA